MTKSDLLAKVPEFTKDFVETFRPERGVIYNSALAGFQDEMFGPALKAAGFELKMESTNPNTGRRIYLYILQPDL